MLNESFHVCYELLRWSNYTIYDLIRELIRILQKNILMCYAKDSIEEDVILKLYDAKWHFMLRKWRHDISTILCKT